MRDPDKVDEMASPWRRMHVPVHVVSVADFIEGVVQIREFESLKGQPHLQDRLGHPHREPSRKNSHHLLLENRGGSADDHVRQIRGIAANQVEDVEHVLVSAGRSGLVLRKG